MLWPMGSALSRRSQRDWNPAACAPWWSSFSLSPTWQNFCGRKLQRLGGGLENLRRGLRMPHLGGNQNDLKLVCKLQRFQQRTQAIVPIGNHRQPRAAFLKHFNRRQHVIKNAPRFGRAEVVINSIKKTLARQGGCEASECFIHHRGPTVFCVFEFAALPPRFGKALGNFFRRGIHAVARGHFGIGVAHRRPRLDERAADIKRYGRDIFHSFKSFSSTAAASPSNSIASPSK